MIELNRATSGEIGRGSWFSELFFSAAHSGFTGGVLVKTPQGDAAVFFRGGSPVHAGGAGFRSHFLGEILIQRRLLNPADLPKALAEQQAVQGTRPLLGSLLVAHAGVDPAEVKRSVQLQNEARIALLMALTSGTWQAAPGENARVRELGVLTEPWPIFYSTIETQPSEAESRELADKLLGKAVLLKSKGEGLPGWTATEAEKQLLHYLEKPRKPDQLERAVGNRRLVRGFLRALELHGLLEVVPVGKAIPINKALKGQAFQVAVEAEAAASAGEPVSAPVRENGRPGRSDSGLRRPSAADAALLAELRAFHQGMKEKNHFEVLGATKETSSVELRKLFTNLAKRFHPDAFPAGSAEEASRLAREISARLNDAYQTLTNEKSRAEYVVLLADSRFKGDARKAERAKEADTKAKMGLVMLKKKEYPKARDFFRIAMEMDPASGEHKAHFAWSLFSDPKAEREDATQRAYGLLLEALKLSPRSAMIHFYTGQVLKQQDRLSEALHHFRATLQLDPKHQDATREVRLIEMRSTKKKGEEKKGPLSKLFKRE